MTYNGHVVTQKQGPSACPANASCCACLFCAANGCKYPGSNECWSPGPGREISASLPNCLVIGDSVSNQYTPHVAALLNDTCLVQHAPWAGGGSANNAQNGLRNLQAGHWLRTAERPDRPVTWDIIMFNFGLHDLPKTTPELLDVYTEEMENITQLLLAAKPKNLLYALTTPFEADANPGCGPFCANHTMSAEELYTLRHTTIPQPKADGNGRCGPPACVAGSLGCGTPAPGRDKLGCGPPTNAVTKLNGRASQVMAEHNVPTLDLNTLVHSHCGDRYTSCELCDNETEYMGIQCGYHYSPIGIPILANAVADRFRQILAPAPAPTKTDDVAPPPEQAATDTQPIMDVLTRTIGASAASAFELSLDPQMEQGFTMAPAKGQAAKVSITASGLPELGYGAGYYLRTRAGMSFSWERTGGNHVAVPAGGLPAVAKPVTLKKKAKWSYYQNVCTQSYSMWWWPWERWEKELDWAALWGINLVLAYTGQEKIFRDVFNSIGVNDSVLNNTFDGPAFLTWSRGQGTFGVGGPLPNYWIESQHALQVKIMNRLRDLGMYGILPGFQGNVPQEMPEIFPHANTSNGWLDALDPLFDTIGHGVGTAMQAEFGPGSFVEADGWFALETGPWLSSDSTSVAALGDGADAAEEAGCFFGRVDQDGHPIPFIIPSEEEAFTRASSVFASLVAAKPDATWVYQGYPWFRVYSQGAKCNQTALRLFVKGFTDAIPKDRLLVLDLVADSPGRALWRYPADPVIGPFARNASLIWCALNNWGGAVHIGGDISYVLNETRAAMATPNVNGVGLTPEGIDNSPAYFSLVLDSAWTEQPTARDWLQEWGAGRCGAANIKAAAEAYDLLFQTVYRPGKPYLWCCSNPVFCPTVHPGEAPAKPDYNVTLLRTALELMVEAAPSCPGSGFHYDLVDVAREWLSMSPCLDAFDRIDKTAPAPELTAQVEALLEVGRDADDMMATDEGFLLGKWLKSSREVSDWDGSGGSLADFYEWNSRVQITTWAGGYSRREWSGMVKEYYAGRVKVWLNNTLAASAASAAAADTNSATTSTYRAVQGFDCNFQDIARHKSECAGKSTAACIAILERLCDADAACIGFNSPGDILKKGCSGWEAAPHSTMFFKPGHVPPNLPPPPTSSCVDGFCSTRVVNGTHNGTTCGGACPAPPKPPPLASQLADFASRWQNETWTEAALPSKPVGDAVAMAKKLLAKYKSDDGTGAIDHVAVVARHDVSPAMAASWSRSG